MKACDIGSVTASLLFNVVYSDSVVPCAIWESHSRLAGQEIVRRLQKTKVYYYTHKSPSQVPIQSQMNPLHAFIYCSFKTRFNIILVSTSMFSKLYLYF